MLRIAAVIRAAPVGERVDLAVGATYNLRS
jgi:hypothetical protein